jgi:ketosteroid isomerase-like protein
MDSVETVTAAYEAFARADIPALLDLLADDVEWSSPMTLPHGGQFHGKTDVGRFFQGIGEAWDPLNVEMHGLSAISADTVITIITASGQMRSGGAGGYGAAHQFTVVDGKITAFHEYVDLDKPLQG